jgi:hypothetical protein
VLEISRKLKLARARRAASKLRAAMIAMENAAIAGDLVTLHKLLGEQVRLVMKLRNVEVWSDSELLEILRSGGMIRFLHDPVLEDIVGRKVEEAEQLYGEAA